MKTVFLVLLLSIANAVVYAGAPLKVTEKELTVNIYKKSSSRISAIWKDYERNRVAVAANKTKSGMVELYFMEGLTAKNKQVWLELSISGVVDNVRIVPNIQFSKELRSWELLIDPAHLNITTLKLGSYVNNEERGDFFLHRKYKLKKGANE
jgi:hypothetical protein